MTLAWCAVGVGSLAQPCASGCGATRSKARQVWCPRAAAPRPAHSARSSNRKRPGSSRSAGNAISAHGVSRRIQQELRRQHQYRVGLAAIHTVLKRHEVAPLRRPKRPQAPLRYNASLPGERVQMDTMKLATGLYPYTFIDDCTRYLVAALYSRRTAANTLDVFELIFDRIPFPIQIQRLQTDNGTEFMAYKVRDELFALRIKHRPIPPRTPHLNGKVERVQQTMLTEFYATTTMDSPSLADDLGVWLLDYNYRRVHGSLGTTPMQRCAELLDQTPLWDDVAEAFDPVKEITFVDRLTLRRRTFTANKRTKK